MSLPDRMKAVEISEPGGPDVLKLTERDVPAYRLEPVGRGESEPVAENEIDGADNPEGRAQNRRVEFVLQK